MKPMCLLVVGGGSIGERHIRCFSKVRPWPRMEIELCEPRRRRAVELLEKHPIVTVYRDFGKIDLKRFDAAVVASPASCHVAQARKLVAAGCHVLIEKPLCVAEGEKRSAKLLLAESRRRKKTVGVGYTYRSYPLLAKLAAELPRVGAPRLARVRLAYDYPRYRPDYRRNYFARQSTGGGALLDIASHALAFLVAALGPVEAVQAMTGRVGLEGVSVEDSALVLLRFRSGVLGELWTSACQPRREAEIEIIGPRGHMIWANCFDGTNELRFTTGDGDESPSRESLPLDGDEPFTIQAAAFLDACEGRPSGMVTLADALHVQEICWAARRSASRGRREIVRG